MKNNIQLTENVITTKIHEIRGQKVILDSDLAELYEVETKHLKRQVNRNIDVFQLSLCFN